MRSVLAGIAAGLALAACGAEKAPPPAASFVGSAACAACHAAESAEWRASHHALAMQEATAATVRGDFGGVDFAAGTRTARFDRRGDAFVVNAIVRDGTVHEFAAKWTFGVHPLQQVLLETDGGRMQAFDVAWDTRDKAMGGQRWFALLPEEDPRPGSPLHWTGASYEWNSMCAECHSTNLQKGYDAERDRFATTATEHGVGCEGCHGPGSAHVAWAAGDAAAKAMDASKGLVAALSAPQTFAFVAGKPTAQPTRSRDALQAEACGRCHARRTTTTTDHEHGRPLLDTHLVALLDDPLYFADGQIEDEVFEYGSFVQSRMHHQGVVCTDCHTPHSGRLRAEGNALCTRCHDAKTFDGESHHHHRSGTRGSLCVDCHMPERTYMVVDPRRDHSLRVPRPDLSLRLPVPNACGACHADKGDAWAAAAVTSWRGADAKPLPEHWAEALHAGRTGSPRSVRMLARAVARTDWPAIVRGTAASLLQGRAGDEVRAALATASKDEDALVRLGAVSGLDGREVELRERLLVPLLRDPVRNVRTAAAYALADRGDLLRGDDRAAFELAAKEHDAAQQANAERDWAWVNRALFAARRGDLAAAEAHCRKALLRDAGSVRAATNLADLLRDQGRDAEGEAVLRAAIPRAFDARPLRLALGLLLVRRGEREAASAEFAAAAAGAGADPRAGYVYAVALVEQKRVDEAVRVLEDVQRRDPWNRDVLEGLVAFTREKDRGAHALPWARKLLELAPDDEDVRAMVEELERGR